MLPVHERFHWTAEQREDTKLSEDPLPEVSRWREVVSKGSSGRSLLLGGEGECDEND